MDRKGIVIAGIGGNYEVFVSGGETVRVKARGVFRKEKISPLIGDRVVVTDEGFLSDILPRRNQMIRPAAANIDQILIVFALRDPDPHFGLLDRFLAEAAKQKIPARIAFNKTDLLDPDEDELLVSAAESYRKAGYPVFLLEARSEEEGPFNQLSEVRSCLSGKVTVLAGPSGVGKSSLINALIGADQEVGELSEKIARGKNTTRHARLLPVMLDGEVAEASDLGSWIADTPGFTSFYTQSIEAEELDQFYPEFLPHLGQCYYQDCRHISEPACAVREAVETGEITRLRYDNYRELYQELKQFRKEHPIYQK